MRIAVFVDGNQLPCAPHEASRIAFFARPDGKWGETHSKPLSPVRGSSPEAVSAFLDDVGALTTEAQAVAGASILGKAFAVLNKQGAHIFEITEISPEQLSGIAEDIALAEAKRKLAADAFQRAMPVETDIAGVYTLDLVSALEENPDLSSKMILKPFLKSTPFTELTIICRHMPHWLTEDNTLRITQKMRGEYLIVTVQKRLCGEEIS